MTKVLLTGTYSSFNKGDAAMEIATAEAVKEALKNAEVFISSPFPEYDTEFYKPVPVVWCSRRRLILSTLKLLMLCLWRLIKGLINYDFKLLVRNDEIQDYLTCDVIIDLSGDMQTEDYGVHVTYSHYLPLLMGLAAGKPVILCAQSIGPFKWTKLIARWIMNRVSVVTVRDSISYDYLESIGVNKSQFYLTADMAFLLRPSLDKDVDSILQSEGISIENKRILGVSLSTLCESKFDNNNPVSKSIRFQELMAKCIETVCEEYDLTPLFISHVTGPVATKDDRVICKQVAQKIKRESYVLNGNYRPNELKGVISRSHAFIGTRMHANIAALSSGVPILAISYSHKTPGIMKMFGQEDQVCSIERFTESELLLKAREIINDRDNIIDELTEKIVTVKAESERNIEFIKSAINAPES